MDDSSKKRTRRYKRKRSTRIERVTPTMTSSNLNRVDYPIVVLDPKCNLNAIEGSVFYAFNNVLQSVLIAMIDKESFKSISSIAKTAGIDEKSVSQIIQKYRVLFVQHELQEDLFAINILPGVLPEQLASRLLSAENEGLL